MVRGLQRRLNVHSRHNRPRPSTSRQFGCHFLPRLHFQVVWHSTAVSPTWTLHVRHSPATVHSARLPLLLDNASSLLRTTLAQSYLHFLPALRVTRVSKPRVTRLVTLVALLGVHTDRGCFCCKLQLEETSQEAITHNWQIKSNTYLSTPNKYISDAHLVTSSKCISYLTCWKMLKILTKKFKNYYPILKWKVKNIYF